MRYANNNDHKFKVTTKWRDADQAMFHIASQKYELEISQMQISLYKYNNLT